MQSSARIAVSIFLLSSALATAYHNSAKLRRDGVLNLYPFPRVGRASHKTWQVPVNDLYQEFEPQEKRQLYAFPRVGRGDLSLVNGELREPLPMPHRRTDSPGMWFGPRLGRGFRSQDDDITIQNTAENSERSEPEQIEAEPVMERKKRQIRSL